MSFGLTELAPSELGRFRDAVADLSEGRDENIPQHVESVGVDGTFEVLEVIRLGQSASARMATLRPA